MPELSVRKTTEFSPEVLGFQDGEEMRLVKSVERIDQQVGIAYLVPVTLFLSCYEKHRAACG